MTKRTAVLTVTLVDREDGGLRVSCRDLPGLVLSGADRNAVCDAIIPAMKALLVHKGIKADEIRPALALPIAIQRPSPRDVDVSVLSTDHSAGASTDATYVIEYHTAA